MKARLASVLAVTGTSILHVAAWGQAGHEIVATIAQIHLQPSTTKALCAILPEYADCHLAPVAAWADKVRMHMRWSGALHYVNGNGDHPSQHCVFGQEGWAGPPGVNVLSGIRNTTMWLEKGYDGAEEALKFLIHFMGDVHQPLHLTGRDKGGNGVKVRFNRRITNMHSVWDNALLASTLLNVPQNYREPLPYPHIEAALRGKAYDPLIRQIMAEGIYDRFNSSISDWISCPSPESSWTSRSYPPSEKFQQLPLRSSVHTSTPSDSTRNSKLRTPPAGLPPTDDSVVCPYAWSAPLHELNCDLIWPAALDDPQFWAQNTYYELDTPEYMGRIRDEWVIQKLLAMGGIRLAAVLNYLYADYD